MLWDGFQMGQILWDFTSQCKIWHVWGIMGWTSSFLEKTETWCADAFEMACSQKRKLETKVTFWNRCYKNNSTNNVYLLPGYLLSTDAILILSPGTAKPTKICAHSGDSDQPVLPSSLIRVLALHSISSQGSNVSSCWQQRLKTRQPQYTGWPESLLGPYVFLRFSCSIFATSISSYTKFVQMSHLLGIWYFSSSINSFFKRACAAIQWS